MSKSPMLRGEGDSSGPNGYLVANSGCRVAPLHSLLLAQARGTQCDEPGSKYDSKWAKCWR